MGAWGRTQSLHASHVTAIGNSERSQKNQRSATSLLGAAPGFALERTIWHGAARVARARSHCRRKATLESMRYLRRSAESILHRECIARVGARG